MNRKNVFVRGTLLLTAAGVSSRLMGFFYRIFLANVIGAEGMGIYQLIFPIYSLCLALSASGIETAVSKLTAEKMILGQKAAAEKVLKTGLTLSVLLSFCCSAALFRYAGFLSVAFLKDERCTILLKLLAPTIPFAAAHACLCGYYFGLHKTLVPALSQLLEQGSRVLAVFLLYRIFLTNSLTVSPVIAVTGIFVGELCSFLLTITCFLSKPKSVVLTEPVPPVLKEIVVHTAPLTANRIIINLLSGMEAFMIPNSLKAYGMPSSAALSIYGILNGMALPFIFFPNALTGAISTLLLPTVSEYAADKNISGMKKTLQKTFSFCLVMGMCFLLFSLSSATGLAPSSFIMKLPGISLPCLHGSVRFFT